eukprot:m.305336 g.305336  ORF g.305336 m.305336 type:complete len:81 (+) comp17718_c0_seq1:854-1096(+)
MIVQQNRACASDFRERFKLRISGVSSVCFRWLVVKKVSCICIRAFYFGFGVQCAHPRFFGLSRWWKVVVVVASFSSRATL